MKKNKNLEGRILRDKIAEIGFLIGSIGGFGYWFLTKDGGTSFVGTVGGGAIGMSGIAYCVGTIVKPIYKAVRRYIW